MDAVIDKERWKKRFLWLIDFHEKHTIFTRILAIIGTMGAGLLIRNEILKMRRRRRKLPNGINGLPIFGSMLTMLIYKEKYFSEMLPKYGDIVTTQIASRGLEFIINDSELLRGIYDKALERSPLYKNMIEENNEMGFKSDITGINQDAYWFERRKSLMVHLTNILNKGRINDNMNEIFQTDIENSINSLLISANGNEFEKKAVWCHRNDISKIVFDLIYFSIFGGEKMDDIKKSNETFLQYSEIAKNWTKSFGKPLILSKLIPKYLSKIMFGDMYEKWFNLHKTFRKYVENDFQSLKERMNNEKNNDNDDNNNDDDNKDDEKDDNSFKCLAERILNANKKESEKISMNVNNNNNRFIYDEKYLEADVQVLFVAGLDTTVRCMDIGIVLAALYPDAQKTVYNELKRVFLDKGEKEFNLSKVIECPYLRAFVLESCRIGAPLPTTPPHINYEKDIRCMKLKHGKGLFVEYNDNKVFWNDIESRYGNNNNNNSNIVEYDYVLPKASLFRANLIYMNKANKSIWGENGEITNSIYPINLDNWIQIKNDKIKFVVNKNSNPFGVPKRDCLGQNLAIKILECFFGNLFLKYQISDAANIHTDTEKCVKIVKRQ